MSQTTMSQTLKTRPETLQNYIGGAWEASSGPNLESFNPTTGERDHFVPDSSRQDVDRAVEAASRAFQDWSKTTPQERSRYLLKIADLIEANLDLFAEAESRDQGKPIWLAKSLDIPRAILNFRHFATLILHHQETSSHTETGALNYTLRSPVGVAGLISPWNLPLYLLTWKIAPAIAAGNTVVCKPSEFTSLTAFVLSQVIQQSGLPAGVVNIVFGRGASAGQALVEHPKVPLISFTGGTATGEQLARIAAPRLKRLSLELGGKNPNLIFADADLDEAVETSVRAAFLNQGEICLCGSRLYVQDTIFDAFVTRFREKTARLKVGDPQDPDTFIGPLVSAAHRDKVQSFIDLAQREGAGFILGADQTKFTGRLAGGYFVHPVIVTNVSTTSRICQDEIFGPFVSVLPFRSEDEVIALANGVRYGLSASVFTKDLGRAHRVASRLQAGTVWVNTWLNRDLRVPFGGVKASGLGREGGEHSLEFFTEVKNVCIRY